jgi:uncharacterized protein YjbI with pentapeptide repeats
LPKKKDDQMQKFEIKSWLDGKVLFACEAESLIDAVQQAVKAETCLNYASLDGARLDGARLDGARLDGARLNGASLFGARLNGARLNGARLDGARLDGARLDGARLDGASLDGASLDGASLDGARLTPIRDDLWAVLCSAPKEVPGLRSALAEGRVDGSTYEGECACLVGTLANVRGCDFNAFESLRPNQERPAERFFLAIKKGDTPETSQFSKLALEWVDLWIENMKAAGMPIATIA